MLAIIIWIGLYYAATPLRACGIIMKGCGCMQKLIDKLTLFGLCLLVLSFTDVRWTSVVMMLGAVAVTSLNSYFDNRLPVVLSAAYVVMCLISPEFVIFLPLIAYDCAGMDRWIFRLGWCAAMPACFFMNIWQTAAVIALSCGMAFLLQYRTSATLKTQSAYYVLTDDAKEKAASLESKNRELLEKQDYEVRLATLAERNRIAREIHDNVGHLLTRSILQLGALHVMYKGDERMAGELDLVKATLSDAMDSVRSSAHDLHDESVNLRLQLQTMTSGFMFCPIKLRYDAGELPMKLRTCFAAVVREALSNIARHSDAKEAAVTVTEHPAFCQLIIWDNGTVKKAEAAGGMGLQNMADRVNALGGVFRVDRDKGYKIFISVPKEAD